MNRNRISNITKMKNGEETKKIKKKKVVYIVRKISLYC